MKFEAMDPSFQDFEFLDLTDINDAELDHIQNVLYTSDPSVKYPELPWVEPVYDNEEDEESDGSEPACAAPASTLNPEVPPYPPSSTHIPVTMYQMMPPSVYVNNLTSNVSLHPPYIGYHTIYHQQPQDQPLRGGGNRRINKGNPKSREYRANDQDPPSSPIPQQYPGSYIPMHPYNPYYSGPAPGHIQSAQHATGTPIFLPSHVPMYPPGDMGYPYHPPMYSPVNPGVYPGDVPGKDPNHYQPEKLQTYDYNSQNNVKDQYIGEPANQPYIQSGYNNTNSVKDSAPTSYQEKGTTHYRPSNHTEPVVTHFANKNYDENNTDLSKDNEAKSAAMNVQMNAQHDVNYKDNLVKNVVKSGVTGGEKGNDFKPSLTAESKKPDVKFSPPEAKVKIAGAVKYVGDVIVSELKTDAQVFRPANRNKLVFEIKKEAVAVSADVKLPVADKAVDSIVVEVKPDLIIETPKAESVVNEPKQIQTLSAPVVAEEVKILPPTQSVTQPPLQETLSEPPMQEPTPQLGPQEPSVAAPAVAPAGKSWASLFRKSAGPTEMDSGAPKLIARVEPFKNQDGVNEVTMSAAEAERKQKQMEDPQLYRLGENLAKYELDHKAISLQPRGLTNRGNWCYINSTLQALLACPPFYNLLKSLPMPKKNQKSLTPIVDSLVQFVNEFVPLASVSRVNRKERNHRKDDGSMDVQSGTAFEPSYIYKMLNSIRSDTFKVEGRQEDAEEFLSCLLNALNDEMLDIIKLVQDPAVETVVANGDDTANHSQDESDSEWHVMGPKNKGAVTRRSDFGRSPVSDIFRGHLRSRVQRAGDQSTDNVQPFFTLQLDIEKAQSVKEALELLVGRDQLEGVTCTKTNQEVEAWQQVTLEDLPLVLVLHLKWFDYKVDGCTKIVKSVEFPIELKVDPKLMSSTKKYGIKAKQYKLFAVVYHDGKEATKGHYVTDVFHVGYGGWVRYDDSNVRAVQESQVLHPRTPRVPYLLYYRRCDTIGNQTPVR